MRRYLIGGAAILALGAMIPKEPPRPVAAPVATPAASETQKARAGLCQYFGNVAAAAWEAKERGVPQQTATRLATANIAVAENIAPVRDAVAAGYATRTRDGAHHRAFTFCMDGVLGR
jgi:hypothetical protein